MSEGTALVGGEYGVMERGLEWVGHDALGIAIVRVLWYCRCKRIYMIRRKSCILGSWEGKQGVQ